MIPILYKYHKCGDLKYLTELLESSSFYMASRKKMNDMYDCFFSLTHNYIETEMLKNKFSDSNEKDREKFRAYLHTQIYQAYDPGITCFSEKPNNDILWSYYADSAKGVCLEFNFSEDEQELRNAFTKVKYTKDFSIDSKDDLKILPFRKKPIYSNEYEWRIVFNNSGKKCPFKKSSLKAIYIGARCKQEDVFKIMSLVSELGYQVKFYKMSFSYLTSNIQFTETNREDIKLTWPTVSA